MSEKINLIKVFISGLPEAIKTKKELYELLDKRLIEIEKRLDKLEKYFIWICGYDLSDTEIF